jgi:DNA-binding transcriptional regulator GbsR (MarR family)
MRRSPRRPAAPPPAPLAEWERLATDAVGTTIQFWGFKQNHGRVWALLYLRDRAMDASEIRALLGLSKGAVSMVTNELERWRVIHRVRLPGEALGRFRAETELGKMITRVIAEREATLVSRVVGELAEATHRAKAAHAAAAELARLERLGAVAHSAQLAIYGFLATSRLDVRAMGRLLAGEAASRALGRRGRLSAP